MKFLRKILKCFFPCLFLCQPHKPNHFHAHIHPIKFFCKGVLVMKHIVRLSWVESVSVVDHQHLTVDVAGVDVDVPVGVNTFDFVCDPEVHVHCELTAVGELVSDAVVLDFDTPAFPPPPPVKPEAPTAFAFEIVGTQE